MPIIETLILTALVQPSSQTLPTGWSIAGLVEQDTCTWLTASLAELDGLLTDEEVPSFIKPTAEAYFNARKRLIEAGGLLNTKPEIILDGEGGIDIEWDNKNGRLLMYSCRANRNQLDYVYYEGETYGGDYYSPIYSTDRLDWFLKG